MKNIAVLGSTGSIGKQTLDVMRNLGQEFFVYALCADSNAALLGKQANEFMPKVVGIANEEKYLELKEKLNYNPEIIVGNEASTLCATIKEVDVVVNAVTGIAGFMPFVSAIEAGKTIAAANKESIVCADSLIKRDMPLIAPFENGARIIPIDSEQSAIFQCLENEADEMESVILTASGGAFYNIPLEALQNVSIEDALKHPIWSMGKKITVDSATLFNKGLEILEAAYLFGLTAEKVEVVIHPQSVVHSMVRFTDGNVKALMSVPDMRGAIQYALTYPKRKKSVIEKLDFSDLSLSFSAPDCEKFPALRLAFDALRENKKLPTVYNAANEAAVEMFMKKQTGFLDISKRVEYAMSKTYACKDMTMDAIMDIDKLARIYATEWRDSL